MRLFAFGLDIYDVWGRSFGNFADRFEKPFDAGSPDRVISGAKVQVSGDIAAAGFDGAF